MKFRNSDEVHGVVRKVDSGMVSLSGTLRQLGVPKGMGTSLNKLRNSVGDLVAHLEMVKRRS
ncbi:hypothetical protein HUO13_35615 [Saccharopolyspora erythraea]|uniref:hypothetical protein n=1 Tax=Saccharopolyspora erythraea TaxID=1836 RepID=UPI001BAB30A7|nr:hypothetical protein [Saccharopolyspora erythraea]QUG99381.1 hypothetical protein HUO13_02390 [Saccharopolyspora erythraea]QUG99396.1 hypothetical protein HUO13_35615 [Saccharopolyspora erythraea]